MSRSSPGSPSRAKPGALRFLLASAALLRERRHAGPVFAATSGFHLPRCLLLLRMAGWPARAVQPPEADPSFPRRWYWRLREAPALPYDAALMLAARLRGRA